MLQFPAWKVILISLTLLTGTLMALPNAFSNAFLGIEPLRPEAPTAQQLADYNAEMAAAQDSWWPGMLPSGKVNLGLDLRGGVYLLMEIDEDDVVANRLNLMLSDVADTLYGQGVRDKVYGSGEVEGEQLIFTLNRNRMDETSMDKALDRIRDLNTPVDGALGGQRTYEVRQRGEAQIAIALTEAAKSSFVRDAQTDTLQTVRMRIDPEGVRDINPVPQGENRVILEVPGEPDPSRIKELLSQAGNLTFSMVDDTPSTIRDTLATGRAPVGWRLLSDAETGERMLVNNVAVVNGEDVATASQGFDPDDNSPAVNFRLTGVGQKRFSDVTQNNYGKRFAIVLDEQVMSAPRINEPIYGGQVQITGNFTMQEALDLAAIIEAGELPAKLNFMEERTVGPGLGADSIRAGTRASIIGLALVAVFMIATYGRLGFFAVLSLVANIVLILGALSGLGATLTLPGIAGIILTIGMAVDANVLVFERIREEKAAGRTPITSVQAGYERALSTILDANITTFIAAAVLYMLGSGPVKGFAVTLAIGIVTSVFTAFVVTRWITASWLRWARPKTLAI
ncbi:MAG: protein translocase subunit SecD [Hyphomonadaceae bacterium]|nr:protein translocase subunit SecD [Hyphomonadaceae bacterium]